MPTYTYDENQVTAANQVKFYLGQTGTTAATRDFTDEEIAAAYARATLSTTRANVYWTSSDMLTVLVLGFASKGGGLDARKLSKLTVTYGGRSTKLEVLERLRDQYKKLAALYSRTKPRAARLINASGMR